MSKGQEILDRINEFNEKYPEASYNFSHSILDDMNLTWMSISNCLEPEAINQWLISITRPSGKEDYRIREVLETAYHTIKFLESLLQYEDVHLKEAMQLYYHWLNLD